MASDDYPRQYAKSLAGSEHEAFWHQIANNPTDDLPPLVYADYLDEQGHNELARLIRRSINEGHGPTYEPTATSEKDIGTYQNLHQRLVPYVARRPSPWNWGNGQTLGQLALWGRSELGPDHGISLEILTPFGLIERTTRRGNSYVSRGPLYGPHDKGLMRMTIHSGLSPSMMYYHHRAFEVPMTVPELHTLADSLNPDDADSTMTASRLKAFISNPNRFRQPRPTE